MGNPRCSFLIRMPLESSKSECSRIGRTWTADLIDERELNVSRLVEYLEAQWNNRSRLEHMGQSARAFAREHAEEDVIEILEQVGSDAESGSIKAATGR